MPALRNSQPRDCNCLVVRQAARHVTQLYDRFIAPYGLKTSQFSILARLGREGGMTINALAAALVMDRTTLGRNIRPLQRDGLVTMAVSPADRRSRVLRVTDKGARLVMKAAVGWAEAQAAFERGVGTARAAEFRSLLRSVVEIGFPA
ncbi:MAG TPA: MarR family winged helix-turn-helix transcriptional regulator [Stellaceae bacterium]|nr:MarR family winged helix-turn-helix transcriptional regulator [Stellaceae bacterium]